MRGVREPTACHNFLDIEVVPNAPELHGEQPADLRSRRRAQEQHFFEAAPDRAVEHPVVIGRRNEDTASVVGIQHLEDGVDDAAQFAVLRWIFALLAQASNSSNSATNGCAAMKSNTLRRFAAVSPRKEETTLSVRTIASGRPSSNAMTSAVSVLPQPGGPHRSTRSLGRRPCACRTSLGSAREELLDERAVGGRQHDVLETPDRFSYRQQRKTTLAILGDITGQLAHRRGRGVRGRP